MVTDSAKIGVAGSKDLVRKLILTPKLVTVGGKIGHQSTFSETKKVVRALSTKSTSIGKKQSVKLTEIAKSDNQRLLTKKILTLKKDESPYINGKSGELRPLIKYQSGLYHYEYQTDELGRITEAVANPLKTKPKDMPRPKNKSNTPGKLADDQAGHIIADIFGGSPNLDNLVSQYSKLNQGAYRSFEIKLANLIKDKHDIKAIFQIQYIKQSHRPVSFQITYWVDNSRIPHKSPVFNNGDK